jgi:hypothetical protein
MSGRDGRSATVTADLPAERAPWRAVAVPTEHGGWGLTAEPILLGLLVAWSWAGLALGVAALLAFLVRTPLKLWAVDRRRGRHLERDGLAARIAGAELTVIATCAAFALWLAGPAWLIAVVLAAPLVAVELWYDVRSRGRRLVPEVCGATGVAATAAAIALAGGAPWRLAAGLWLVLAARSLASIPYVRVQIQRLHRGSAATGRADAMQVVGVTVAAGAVVADPTVVGGAVIVAVLAIGQSIGMRRSPVPPATVLGLRQTAFGAAVVAATAVGVLAA